MVEESFTFSANSILGTPTSPTTITATSQIIQQLDYPSGWTWFSLNLEHEDMSVNAIMDNLNPTSGDLIKSQTSFDQYVESFGWVGTLDSLTNRSMYQIRLAESDTLEMVGYAVNVELDTSSVASGWNWVSYLPQGGMEVDIALQSLEAISGDVIKSQFTFAMYVEGLGWVGSLHFMNPRLGYLLYSYHGGEIVYPNLEEDPLPALAKSNSEYEGENQGILTLLEDAPEWITDPHQFEHNLTVTAIIDESLINTADSSDMIGAFVGDECRGMSQPIFIESLDQFMVFLMVYANENGEEISFKYYDASEDYIWSMEESVDFLANLMLGTVAEPYVLTLHALGIGDPGYIPETYSLANNYPNPFNPSTFIGFGLPKTGTVELVIYNILGEQVTTLIAGQQNAGYYELAWNALDDGGRVVSAGIYIYQLRVRAPDSGIVRFVETRKMVVLK